MNFKTMQEAYDNRHPVEQDEDFYTYEEAFEVAQDEFLKNPDVLLEFFADISADPVRNVYHEVSDEDSNAHLLAVIINGFDPDACDARYILRERIVKAYADEIRQAANDLVGERK
jgi:hypothetical protein